MPKLASCLIDSLAGVVPRLMAAIAIGLVVMLGGPGATDAGRSRQTPTARADNSDTDLVIRPPAV